MAVLSIPSRNITITNQQEIQQYLFNRGIHFEHWQSRNSHLPKSDEQQKIITDYGHRLVPYMRQNGYQSAEIISMDARKPKQTATLMRRFLRAHSCTKSEARFFVDGEGLFWFHMDAKEPGFSLLCQAGDLIAVPPNTCHWFDMTAKRFVKAIRLFIDQSGLFLRQAIAHRTTELLPPNQRAIAV